jgi:hypothetical protein
MFGNLTLRSAFTVHKYSNERRGDNVKANSSCAKKHAPTDLPSINYIILSI